MKKVLLIVLCLVFAAGAIFAGGKQESTEEGESGGTESTQTEEKKVKAGFVYIGPAGDFGWTYAHEQGRYRRHPLRGAPVDNYLPPQSLRAGPLRRQRAECHHRKYNRHTPFSLPIFRTRVVFPIGRTAFVKVPEKP